MIFLIVSLKSTANPITCEAQWPPWELLLWMGKSLREKNYKKSISIFFHLGAMVPITLSQPPETTIAISLFGVDLIRIMAKEGERCCTYLAITMLILWRIALWPPFTGWSSFIPSRPAHHQLIKTYRNQRLMLMLNSDYLSWRWARGGRGGGWGGGCEGGPGWPSPPSSSSQGEAGACQRTGRC